MLELLENDLVVIWATAIVCFLTIIVVVRAILILMKCKMRRGELIHHIRMILDRHGCRDGLRHYEACKHIVEHYGVSLSSVAVETGFNGDLPELMVSAAQSEIRAKARESEQMTFYPREN
jgi:hypothetical protein